MRKKRERTAAELMAELEADPRFQAKEAENKKKRQARHDYFFRLEAPIVQELASRGLAGPTLDEMIEKQPRVPQAAVDVLLSWLGRVTEPRLAETLVRWLGSARTRFDGHPLAASFDATSDEALKWAIMNTIAMVRPFGIEKWLSNKLKVGYWRDTFQALVAENDEGTPGSGKGTTPV